MSQPDLVRESFKEVEACSDQFAELFYRNLFEIAPQLKQHFAHVDMATQGAMVVQVVRIAVGGLEDFDQIRPTLESLGYRHANYGVKPEQYEVAVDAFIRSLQEILEGGLDDDLEQDWRDVLTKVTSTMSEGEKQVAQRLASRPRPFRNEEGESVEIDAYTSRFMPVDTEDHSDLYADIDLAEYPKSISVEYVGEKMASAAPLQTILDVSLQNDIAHTCVCGGIAKCSTCRVAVLEGLGHCLPRNQAEKLMAQRKGFSPELRLACQTRIIGPVKLKRLVHDQADINAAANMGRDQVGREMPLAVMFADINGFTPFSENNLAYDIVHALNRYFDVVGGAIDENEGYIDKYIGDGIMALFGLNRGRDIHPCIDAVNAAIGAVSGLEKVNEYLRSHLNHEFSIGVGIHYGTAIVGEVGLVERRQFTAIGDVVNTAARLEGEAKSRSVNILISDAVLNELPAGMFKFGPALELSLKGKTGKQSAHEVLLSSLN